MASFYSTSTSQGDVLYSEAPVIDEIGHGRNDNLSVVDGGRNLHALSLTLNTQMSNATPFSNNSAYGDTHTCIGFGAPNSLVGYNNVYQYEQAGIASVVLKSKYLKATQHLLDELVSVREAVKRNESVNEAEVGSIATSDANESTSASSKEISSIERQHFQDKLDKLLSMLDEVDKSYKQYYHQMQILVSSFELAAGFGAAKPYTTLALKTISRHFRCLRDAVSGQIEATRKSLGEQDSSQGGVIPRLRYVDQQLRQQRTLQQFGMLRHTWRPQRGLPENAVTIFRAWLFEHFLHPYPKDSEKIMLARRTGLTRGQVANWFINARVRLWKPMVEEMYKEEFSNADLNSNSCHENVPKPIGDKCWASEAHSRRSAPPGHDVSDTNANHQTSELLTKTPNDQNSVMSYQVQELRSYGVDNRVSLALGLQRVQGDIVADNGIGAGSDAAYSYLNSDNQSKRFGSSSLMSDFVA